MRACYQGHVYVCCLDSPRELDLLQEGLVAKIDDIGLRHPPEDPLDVLLRAGPTRSIAAEGAHVSITIDEAQYKHLRETDGAFYEEFDGYALMITKP